MWGLGVEIDIDGVFGAVENDVVDDCAEGFVLFLLSLFRVLDDFEDGEDFL